MKVAFRVDVSTKIGTGHLMRCLTLADALREYKAQIVFISRDLPGFSADFIYDRGYELSILPSPSDENFIPQNGVPHAAWLKVPWEEDAAQTSEILKGFGEIDWLVIDHYALDQKWEQKLSSNTKNIMVIDDLADRQHSCDLLLDQNFYLDIEDRYKGLVALECKQLLGPDFALLSNKFKYYRNKIGIKSGKIKKILIFLGGVDLSNETAKAIEAFKELKTGEIELDVVVGNSNPHRDDIKNMCDFRLGFNYHCQVSNMAELMMHADLSIGAGGSTTSERMCLGVPSIVITIAKNQEKSIQDLAEQGYLIYAGKNSDVSKEYLTKIIHCLDKENLIRMSKKNMLLVDGMGTERVVNTILLF